MKKILIIITVAVFVSLNLASFAQPPHPPANPSGNGNLPVGAGAPIGSGVGILLGLAGLYAGKKIYNVVQDDGDSENPTN